MIAMLQANKQNNPRLVNKHSIKICGLCSLCTSFSAMNNLLAITRIFFKENHIIDYIVNDLPFPSLLYKLCQPDLLQCNGRLPLDCFHKPCINLMSSSFMFLAYSSFTTSTISELQRYIISKMIWKI